MKNKIAYLGIYITLALMFSYLELLIPIRFPIPGIKLGLANLVVVILSQQVGWREASFISVIRVIVSGFLFSNLASIVYSLAGCILSIVVMYFMDKSKKFSIVGVSIGGGVFHNLGQLIVAMLVLENISLFYYFPFLLIAGVLTGCTIGIVSREVLKRLPKLPE